MKLVLAGAVDTGRRAAVSAVKRRLSMAHLTFYRNCRDPIGGFKKQAEAQHTPAGPSHSDPTRRRLRGRPNCAARAD
jgi:hypothetical protein